jgi:hypothetical protein
VAGRLGALAELSRAQGLADASGRQRVQARDRASRRRRLVVGGALGWRPPAAEGLPPPPAAMLDDEREYVQRRALEAQVDAALLRRVAARASCSHAEVRTTIQGFM